MANALGDFSLAFSVEEGMLKMLAEEIIAGRKIKSSNLFLGIYMGIAANKSSYKLFIYNQISVNVLPCTATNLYKSPVFRPGFCISISEAKQDMEDPFRPQPWARSPHIQTIFGSLKMRVWGKNEMTDVSQEVIVDAGSGVRLLGYHSRQHMQQAKGLIILLHGWEGSSDSTYILSTGRFF